MTDILQKGDKIGVFSPACKVERDCLLAVKGFIEGKGYEVYLHPQNFEKLHQSAGTSIQKAQALTDLYLDPEIKAIFAAAGGNRCLHMLKYFDFSIAKQNPKPVIGYSDVSAMMNM